MPTAAWPLRPTHGRRRLRNMRTTCPTEPFSGLPIGDKRAFPLLTVSAPNSSRKYNSLQNRRERRPSHARPVQRSRRGDRSPISLSPSQRASASLAPMWPSCRLAFLQLRRIPWNMPRPNIACSLANLTLFSSDFSLEAPPTCISATDANPCTPPRHQNRPPKALPAASEGVSTALTGPAGSLAAMSPGPILAISPLTKGVRLRDDRE